MTWASTTVGTKTVVVPPGVTRAYFDVAGGSTHSGLIFAYLQPADKAKGGRITGYMTVVPGETLYIDAGGGAYIEPSFLPRNDGYSGGSSASIGTGPLMGDRIVVAGGAGGCMDDNFAGNVTLWGGNGSGGPTAQAGEGSTGGGGASGASGGAGGGPGSGGTFGASANPSGSDSVYFDFTYGPGRAGHAGGLWSGGNGGLDRRGYTVTISKSSGGGNGYYGGGGGGGGVAGYASVNPFDGDYLAEVVYCYGGAGGGGNGYHDVGRCTGVTEYTGVSENPHVYIGFEDITVTKVNPTTMTTVSSYFLEMADAPVTADFGTGGDAWVTTGDGFLVDYTVKHFSAAGALLWDSGAAFGSPSLMGGIGAASAGTAYVCVTSGADYGGIYRVDSGSGVSLVTANGSLTTSTQWRDVTVDVDGTGHLWAARRSSSSTITVQEMTTGGLVFRTVTFRALDPTEPAYLFSFVSVPVGMKIRNNILWLYDSDNVWRFDLASSDTDVPYAYVTWFEDVPDEANFDNDYFYGFYGIEPGATTTLAATEASILETSTNVTDRSSVVPVRTRDNTITAQS